MTRAAVRLLPHLSVLLLALTAGVAAQAMTLRELRTLEAQEKDGKAYAGYYLVGVMEGLREASDTGSARAEALFWRKAALDPPWRARITRPNSRATPTCTRRNAGATVMSPALQGRYRCTR